MVAGGGAAKPPETQSIEMIRPRRASQNLSAGYLRHPQVDPISQLKSAMRGG